MKDTIEIQLSKAKLLLLLLGATVFVVLGTLFLLYPATFKSPVFKEPEVLRIVGIAAVAFFGVCLVFITKKLFDKKVGLTIDAHGITDNTNGTSVGLIAWDDITGIRTAQVLSTKFIMIDTNAPEKYIERAKNGIAKSAMKANNNMYGSPLSITTNSLQIKHDELEKLLRTAFEERKQ